LEVSWNMNHMMTRMFLGEEGRMSACSNSG